MLELPDFNLLDEPGYNAQRAVMLERVGELIQRYAEQQTSWSDHDKKCQLREIISVRNKTSQFVSGCILREHVYAAVAPVWLYGNMVM